MYERFRGKDKTIVAGLKFDESAKNLIETSLSFSKRTEMGLKFTHAVLPWTASPPIYPGEYGSQAIAQIAEEQRLQDAEKKMDEIIHPYLTKGELSSSVLVGHPAKALMSESLSSRAALIICGVKPVSHRFVPKGFSAAMELMAEASIPVLVVPDHKTYDFSKDRLSILVWDDLTEQGAEALPTAAELAGACRQADLVQVHVHGESKAEIEAFADKVASLIAARNLKEEYKVDKKTIAQKTEDAIQQRMAARLESPPSFLSANDVNYSSEVYFGDLFENMEHIVDTHKPDLVVFGRHHLLHRHPMAFGKVPTHTMLNLEVPVLIAPHL